MALETFARDLGYLDPFLAKLEAHAATLSPAAGARLRTLMGEERARWAEIKALLGGAAPTTTPSGGTTAGPPSAAVRAPSPASVAGVTPRKSEMTPSLTVGSLIDRSR